MRLPPSRPAATPTTPEQKVKLFRQLFSGRQDVFPTRFVSKKTGKPGYAPACTNKFVRGVSSSANGTNALEGVVSPVHFSDTRGFFNTPFNLILGVDAPDPAIRYTLDGTPPTETGGVLYSGPIRIDRTSRVRPAALQSNHLPSSVTTHTYLYGLAAGIRSLPAVSLVTAPSNLFGATGIMEVNPRNTTQHGMAWERPVSVEYIQPWDHGGFDLEAGLRIQGGGYVRERYDPEGGLPFSKYSFRLYFRGDYDASRLVAPYYGLEPGRGRGHADHIACGQVVSHGVNFAHLEKFPAEGPALTVKKVLYYFLPPFMRPTFIVPVDGEFPQAIKALANHKSQFDRPDRPKFFPTRLEAFAAYLGAQVGAKYGQAFYVQDVLKVEDPFPLFT